MTKRIQKLDLETGAETIGLVDRTELASGIADASYIHYQVATATEWIVNHNLGKFPSVTVIDSGGSVVVGNVIYIDENNLKIQFNYEFSGKASLN